MIATGEDFYPRLTMGQSSLSQGIPIAAAILSVLIVGEVFKALEDISRGGHLSKTTKVKDGKAKISFSDWRKFFPYIGRSAIIGTGIGIAGGWFNAGGDLRIFFDKTPIYGDKS